MMPTVGGQAPFQSNPNVGLAGWPNKSRSRDQVRLNALRSRSMSPTSSPSSSPSSAPSVMSNEATCSPEKATEEAPITISAVLNALHEHLQTQTQLLPTLHAQLGLPPSALTDELSALQKRLEECVEKQIEGRREEVEIWMKKCDEVERDSLRMNKALGSHSKSIGASVGELRKQQSLPVRYDMISQYREKLKQVCDKGSTCKIIY